MTTEADLDPEALACASRGLEWLERVCPDHIDWINIATLDMENHCVLDQMFGDFLAIVDIAKAAGLHYEKQEPLPGSWLVDHGFDFPCDDDVLLTEAWRHLLSERLAIREGVTA